MKANVYNGVCVAVKDNGDVVIVSENGIVELPALAGDFIADNSKVIKNLKADLEANYTEIQRQHGVIKDLEGDLAKANDNNCKLTKRNAELEKASQKATSDDKSIVKGVVCRAISNNVVDVDGKIIVHCGTGLRARNVAHCLMNGKVTLSQAKLMFSDKIICREVEPFDWDSFDEVKGDKE